jgi:hypothetical protein
MRRYWNGESRNYMQYRSGLPAFCHNHGGAWPNFRLAARMRLRHVHRTTHLRHMLAALVLLGCHRSVWDHAGQQRPGSPTDQQEHSSYSGETSHNVSLDPQCLTRKRFQSRHPCERWSPRRDSRLHFSKQYIFDHCFRARNLKLGPTRGRPKVTLFFRLRLGRRLAGWRNDVLQPHVGDEVAIVFHIVHVVHRQHA